MENKAAYLTSLCPEVARPPVLVHKYQAGVRNKHEVLPLSYEEDEQGRVTGWLKYECGCGRLFWSRDGVNKVKGCPDMCAPGRTPGRKRMDLVGERRGDLEVVGYDKGMGWLVRCVCGREKRVTNTTMLNMGAYKSCGQCTEHERRDRAIARAITGVMTGVGGKDAPSSALRASDVAEVYEKLNSCSEGHSRISYIADDCPLCIALAQLELQNA